VFVRLFVDRLNEEVHELRFYLKGGDREETKVRIRGKPRAKAKQRFKRGEVSKRTQQALYLRKRVKKLAPVATAKKSSQKTYTYVQNKR